VNSVPVQVPKSKFDDHNVGYSMISFDYFNAVAWTQMVPNDQCWCYLSSWTI